MKSMEGWDFAPQQYVFFLSGFGLGAIGTDNKFACLLNKLYNDTRMHEGLAEDI